MVRIPHTCTEFSAEYGTVSDPETIDYPDLYCNACYYGLPLQREDSTPTSRLGADLYSALYGNASTALEYSSIDQRYPTSQRILPSPTIPPGFSIFSPVYHPMHIGWPNPSVANSWQPQCPSKAFTKSPIPVYDPDEMFKTLAHLNGSKIDVYFEAENLTIAVRVLYMPRLPVRDWQRRLGVPDDGNYRLLLQWWDDRIGGTRERRLCPEEEVLGTVSRGYGESLPHDRWRRVIVRRH